MAFTDRIADSITSAITTFGWNRADWGDVRGAEVAEFLGRRSMPLMERFAMLRRAHVKAAGGNSTLASAEAYRRVAPASRPRG